MERKNTNNNNNKKHTSYLGYKKNGENGIGRRGGDICLVNKTVESQRQNAELASIKHCARLTGKQQHTRRGSKMAASDVVDDPENQRPVNSHDRPNCEPINHTGQAEVNSLD